MGKGEMIEEVCDVCGIAVTLSVRDFEEAMAEETLILCPECQQEEDARRQEEEVTKPKRQFKYYVDDIETVLPNLDMLGVLGWELVHIHNDKAYLKMEIF